MNGAPVASVDLAAAPDELPGGKIDRRARAAADAIAQELTPGRSAALADALNKVVTP
jgi:hypothetical protein